jgi:Zn-dependent protease with chaperone function
MRALLALALAVGFYLLAVSVALLLFAAPLVEILVLERIHLKLMLFCWVGAALVLGSLAPRPDPFTAPGPELERANHPRLFAENDRIAGLAGQAGPSVVYLLPDVNAFVTQRGGFLGLGSRRVLGLGLPLLQILSVSELRAVLAHEFGHYHAGDTRLGPLIHSTAPRWRGRWGTCRVTTT